MLLWVEGRTDSGQVNVTMDRLFAQYSNCRLQSVDFPGVNRKQLKLGHEIMHTKKGMTGGPTYFYFILIEPLFNQAHKHTQRERERETGSDMLFDWAQGVGLSDDLNSSLQSH